MKNCSACGLARPLEEFRKRTISPDGLAYDCRACHARHTRERRGGIKRLYWEIPQERRADVAARMAARGETPAQYVERLVTRDLRGG